MELAHTVGDSGPEIELLLIGGAMLVLSIVFFVQKSVKPAVSIVLLAGAVLVGIAAFALGGGEDEAPAAGTVPAPEGVTLEIVSPQDGATVPAGEPVEVEVVIEGGSLTKESESEDPTEGHLHIFIDGEIASMPVSEVAEIELEPGTYQVAVEFTAANHLSYDPRIIEEIEVTAE